MCPTGTMHVGAPHGPTEKRNRAIGARRAAGARGPFERRESRYALQRLVSLPMLMLLETYREKLPNLLRNGGVDQPLAWLLNGRRCLPESPSFLP